MSSKLLKKMAAGFGLSLVAISITLAQTSAPVTHQQILPGSTGSISPVQGVTTATADTPQHKMLNSALSPETRQTLQEAMNAGASADKVTVGPNEAIEMNGTQIQPVSFDSLPAAVKNALGTSTQEVLHGAGQ